MAFLTHRRTNVLLIAILDIWLLSSPVVAGMMGGGGMMGHHKGQGGTSSMEAMLVAGILAKLLSGNKNEKEMTQPMIVPMPMPMVYHHSATPTMNIHHMPSYGWPHMAGGGGGGGGYGMMGHGGGGGGGYGMMAGGMGW